MCGLESEVPTINDSVNAENSGLPSGALGILPAEEVGTAFHKY